MTRLSLWKQMRMLGVREGFRTWREFTPVAPSAERMPEFRVAHGERPRLPGYRRRG